MKLIRTALNAGELSPYMDAREDMAKYHAGCSKLVNGTILPYGGVVKRSGTEYVNKAKQFSAWVTSTAYPVGAVVTKDDVFYYCATAHTSGTFATDLAAAKWVSEGDSTDGAKARLLPFQFSATDNLMLEFGMRYIRFFKDGDRIYETAKSITGITLASGVRVKITIATHGYTTGNTIYISDVEGTTELNGNEYVVTYVDANSFYLDGTDSDDFTAWVSGGTCEKIYEVISPYDSTEIFEINVTQSADVMYIAHTNYSPRKLSRYDDDDWTLTTIVFTGGPFLEENVTAASLMGFARTGGTARVGYYFPAGATGTLTASGTGNTPFLSAHVGSYWLLRHTRTDNKVATADNDTHATPSGTGIKILGDFTFVVTVSSNTFKLWRKQGNGTWQEYRNFDAATAYTGTEEVADEPVYYTYTRSSAAGTATLTAKNQINKGIVRVDSYSSSTVVGVTVIDPVMSDNATDNAVTTSMWAEGAWSEYRGYPRCCVFYEDRLDWAGTTNNPHTIWGSKSGEYENHTAGVNDNDAYIFAINDNDVSEIQWIAAKRVLVAGTATGEYVISANNPNNPITPTDVKAIKQTTLGSMNLQPIVLNDRLFYVQRNGKKIRAMQFNYETESYQSIDTTRFANHILEVEPVDWAVQTVPDSILWVVRSDGQLLSFSYEPEEEVFAWARHVTGSTLYTPVGFFESVAVIAGDIEDEIWVSVKRVINSTIVRYIEKFSTRYIEQIDEAVCVDSATISQSNYGSQDIIYAADTVRYGSGIYGSGLYGV